MEQSLGLPGPLSTLRSPPSGLHFPQLKKEEDKREKRKVHSRVLRLQFTPYVHYFAARSSASCAPDANAGLASVAAASGAPALHRAALPG